MMIITDFFLYFLKGDKMYKLKAIIAGISIFFLIASVQLFAQSGMTGQAGKGMNKEQNAARMYDTKTVETVSGEVLSVDKTANPNGKGNGVHLMLKTDKETITVRLGPDQFIESQTLKINPKDKITVTGSRVSFQGKTAILAAEISKGGQTMKLRDSSGTPVWAGTGKKNK
jgi:hypothetical protein